MLDRNRKTDERAAVGSLTLQVIQSIDDARVIEQLAEAGLNFGGSQAGLSERTAVLVWDEDEVASQSGLRFRARFWTGADLVFDRDGMELESARRVLSLLAKINTGTGLVSSWSEGARFELWVEGRASRAGLGR